jgi:hypothetical protein
VPPQYFASREKITSSAWVHSSTRLRHERLLTDLSADRAPLTDEQMLAESAIMAMRTGKFWE